jgi:nitronate monooxygenase
MKCTRRDLFKTSAAAVGATVGLVDALGMNAAQSGREIPMPTERSRALMALFGLKYPIFEAPHGFATNPDLAIAVSNAGAMGALAGLVSRDDVRNAVSKVRSGTKKSFFINYILRDEPTSLRAALDAGAPVIQFSWGMPTREMVSAIRSAGAKLGMQVTSSESARAALDLGADYLVCQGIEAGGHVQANRDLYEALPNVLKEARQTPVVASGGIGNGQGIRKALLAGASAAMLGTRFVATVESNAHEDYKRAITVARAHDTVLTLCFADGWPNAPHRALRNRTFVMWDAAGCPPAGKRPGERDVVATRPDGSKILRYWYGSPHRGLEGAVTECVLHAGLSVEFVRDVPAAGELVERLWRECETAHTSLERAPINSLKS